MGRARRTGRVGRAEYLMSLFSPGGSFSAIGYTQAEVLPVIQVVSVTGIWGVGFLLTALPALAATVLTTRTAWLRLLPVAAVLTVGVAGYGVLRLANAPDGPGTTVALADVRQSEDSLPIASAEAQQVLAAYLDEAAEAGAAGATVLVLPEKVFKVTEPELADLGRRIGDVAAADRITIVVGLTLRDRSGVHNIAMAYGGAARCGTTNSTWSPGGRTTSPPETGSPGCPARAQVWRSARTSTTPIRRGPTPGRKRPRCWSPHSTSTGTAGCTAGSRWRAAWRTACPWYGLPGAAGWSPRTPAAGSSPTRSPARQRPPRRCRCRRVGSHAVRPVRRLVRLAVPAAGRGGAPATADAPLTAAGRAGAVRLGWRTWLRERPHRGRRDGRSSSRCRSPGCGWPGTAPHAGCPATAPT
ncbi:hypothetical protein ACFQZ4_08050 [Catellatospora coxensis]